MKKGGHGWRKGSIKKVWMLVHLIISDELKSIDLSLMTMTTFRKGVQASLLVCFGMGLEASRGTRFSRNSG